MKAKTLTYFKKKAWASFSKYIRQKSANKEGMVACYTCFRVFHWKQIQAGHGLAGRNNAVLFMEEVVRPQCAGCNLFGGGKYTVFTEKLIKELGLEEYGRLVILSNQVVKYTRFDYERIREEYEEKIKGLNIQ